MTLEAWSHKHEDTQFTTDIQTPKTPESESVMKLMKATEYRASNPLSIFTMALTWYVYYFYFIGVWIIHTFLPEAGRQLAVKC